jgi:hypothetical protein
MNGLFSNNSGSGVLVIGGSDSNKFYGVGTGNNSADGIHIDASNDNTFYDQVKSGTNGQTACEVVAGTTGNTFDDGAHACTSSTGTATVTTTLNYLNTFGSVITDDATNANTGDLVASVLAYASITDWLYFDNLYRTWGKSNLTTSTHSTNRGTCTSGNCAMWDWRPVTADTEAKYVNPAFVAAAACPVNGNDTVTRLLGDTFLKYAYEVVGDGVGDDDMLCESNEGCIYSPNQGAYQG